MTPPFIATLGSYLRFRGSIRPGWQTKTGAGPDLTVDRLADALAVIRGTPPVDFWQEPRGCPVPKIDPCFGGRGRVVIHPRPNRASRGS